MVRIGNERLGNRLIELPVAAGIKLTECTMAAINADGYAVPAEKAEGLLVAGCVQRYCDNTAGADGALYAQVARGAYVWGNDGTIDVTDVLKKCYIYDSTTVTLTPDGSSVAGTILGVEDDGVIVDMTQI